MDLATLQTLVTTDLPPAGLQVYLAAAVEAVDERLGPPGPVTEGFRVHGSTIQLSYQALEVLYVSENGTLLDAADYSLRPSGRMLDRVGRRSWGARVAVQYQRPSDMGRRDRVIVGLVKLDLTHNPGLASVRFGSWADTYRAQGDATYADEREALLASLFDDAGVLR